jgi:integrase
MSATQRGGGGSDSSQSNPKLLTILRSKLRLGHYSRRTEQAYVSWTRRFVRHHGLVHPVGLAEPEVLAFLRYLAEDQHVAQATQSQALAALQFLYQHVIGRPLALEGKMPRARTPARLPVVLTRTEVVRVLAAGLDWAWQWVFPATRRWRSGSTGERGRHHLDPSAVQRAMSAAVRRPALGSGRRVIR